MAFDAGTVTAQLDLDSTGFKKGMAQAQTQLKKTKGTMNSTAKSADGLGSSVGGASASIGSLGKAGIAGAAIAGVTLLGRAVGGLAKDLIALGAGMEQTRVSFEVLLGSAEAGNAMIDVLNEFANVTPFVNDQVIKAGKGLIAFGVAAEDVEPTLRKIGDISAATGKDFNELTTIFGKARISGKIMAEDLNQLVDAGINVFPEFAKQLGVSTTEVKKMASEGKIGFANLEQAFTDMTGKGGQFFEMMKKQSNTFIGLTSTMQGKIQTLGIAVGEVIVDKLKPGLRDMISFLDALKASGPIIKDVFDQVFDSFTSIFDEFPEIENMSQKIVDVLIWIIKQVAEMAVMFTETARMIVRSFKPVIKTLISVGKLIVGVLTLDISLLKRGLKEGKEAMGNFAFVIADGFGTMKQRIADIRGAVVKGSKTVKNQVKKDVKEISEETGKMSKEALKKLEAARKKAEAEAKKIRKAVKSAIKNAINGAMDAAITIMNQSLEIMKNKWQEASNQFQLVNEIFTTAWNRQKDEELKKFTEVEDAKLSAARSASFERIALLDEEFARKKLLAEQELEGEKAKIEAERVRRDEFIEENTEVADQERLEKTQTKADADRQTKEAQEAHEKEVQRLLMESNIKKEKEQKTSDEILKKLEEDKNKKIKLMEEKKEKDSADLKKKVAAFEYTVELARFNTEKSAKIQAIRMETSLGIIRGATSAASLPYPANIIAAAASTAIFLALGASSIAGVASTPPPLPPASLFFQDGGVAPGNRNIVVGEQGPELVRLGQTSRVFSNEDTNSLLGGSSVNFGEGSIIVQGNMDPDAIDRLAEAISEKQGAIIHRNL